MLSIKARKKAGQSKSHHKQVPGHSVKSGERVARETIRRLNVFIAERLLPCLPLRQLAVSNIKYAWNRVFNVEFDFITQ